MKIKEFTYTKQKDEQVKLYTVLMLDPPEDKPHLIGGIDLTKLNDDETKELILMHYEYEVRLKNLQLEALKKPLAFESLIESHEYVDVIDAYKTKMQPYIRKAYRVFIKTRITQPDNPSSFTNDGICECLMDRIIRSKNMV